MDALYSTLEISYEQQKEIIRKLVKKDIEQSETIATQAAELAANQA